MAKATKKKAEVLNENISKIVKKPSRRISADEMNLMVNIGESPLRTYEMLRNRFLNIQ